METRTPTHVDLLGAIRSHKLAVARQLVTEREAVRYLQAKLDNEGDDPSRSRQSALEARQLAADAYDFGVRQFEYLERKLTTASKISIPGPQHA